MDELRRLYSNIEWSTSPTDFYDRVYRYLQLVNTDEEIKKRLSADRKLMKQHALEKRESFPVSLPSTDWTEDFLKEMNHLESGNAQFLSYYLDVLNRDIYDFFEWNKQGTVKSAEFLIMRSGAKLTNKDTEFEPISLPLMDKKESLDRLNKIYIDYWQKWQTFVETFHTLLLAKFSTPKPKATLELKDNGYFRYCDQDGLLTVSSREFKLFKLLYDRKNEVVSYSDILNEIYNKSDSTASRMELNNAIKKLKEALFILPKSSKSFPDIFINHRNAGYSLDLQGEE